MTWLPGKHRTLRDVAVATIPGAVDAARRLPSGRRASPGMDKLTRVQDDIDDAQDIMRHNIASVVGRGEQLECLVDKSEGFSMNARAFQKQSVGLRDALWWKNAKTIATMVGIVLALLLLVFYMACGSTFCVGKRRLHG